MPRQRSRNKQPKTTPTQMTPMSRKKATFLLICLVSLLFGVLWGIALASVQKLPPAIGAFASGIQGMFGLIILIFGTINAKSVMIFLKNIWKNANLIISIVLSIFISGIFAFTLISFNPTGIVPSISDPTLSGTSYTVKNTSEQLPDGVYFRHSLQTDPSQPTPTPIYGFGVFKADAIQVSCWAWSNPVSNDKIWYYAYNVTRPTVAGRENRGWISAHYVNDDMTANHPSPSIPQCGNPLPTGG